MSLSTVPDICPENLPTRSDSLFYFPVYRHLLYRLMGHHHSCSCLSVTRFLVALSSSTTSTFTTLYSRKLYIFLGPSIDCLGLQRTSKPGATPSRTDGWNETTNGTRIGNGICFCSWLLVRCSRF